MAQRTRALYLFTFVFLAGLLLAGCSGLNDLCVINRYPFAVVLRQKGGKTLTVPSQTTLTFHGAGGYEGNGLDGIQVEDAHRKVLGILNQDSPNVEKQGERINGSTTWCVTLGPPPSSPTFAPFVLSAKPFSIGWIFAGVLLFLGWIEWRAHRNEKRKQTP